MGKWKCLVCGQIFEGDKPPVPCPVCGAGEDAFEPVSAVSQGVFRKDTEDRFLIIGGGVAALETAKAIRERNRTAAIIMISSERQNPYNRPALSDVVADGLSFSAIELEDEAFYQNNNIVMLLGTTVVNLDTTKKEIHLDNGGTVGFDKCCLAVGANAFNPFYSDGDSESNVTVPCHILRNYEDALDVIRLGSKKKVVVVGGGILGIEAAVALRERDSDVTILELSDRIMGAQLDDKSAEMMTRKLRKYNIEIRTKVLVSGLDKQGIVLSDGSKLECDFVLVSAGIRSNLILAKEAGIAVDKGILVDSSMRTNVPDIFAVGDCAEFDGKVQGLWATAVAQARVAGGVMAGDNNVDYVPIVPATVFEAMGIQLFSAGNVNAKHTEEIIYRDVYSEIYRKLLFKEKKLIGAVFYGETKGSKNAMSMIVSGAEKQQAIEILM